MFLSRMSLDLSRQDTVTVIHSPEKQQEMIHTAFGSLNQQVLWRFDYLDGRIWCVMLSSYRPDLTEFHALCGYPGVFPSWDIIDYDDTLEKAVLNSEHTFEICASPCGQLKAPNDTYRNISYLYTWLNREGKNCGFDVLAFTSITSTWHMVKGNYLLLATWKGRLKITDENQFLWACRTGIGGNRQYGAGLMTFGTTDSIWHD